MEAEQPKIAFEMLPNYSVIKPASEDKENTLPEMTLDLRHNCPLEMNDFQPLSNTYTELHFHDILKIKFYTSRPSIMSLM